MTDTESRYENVNDYLAEISRYPLLTAEEEIDLSRRLGEGRHAARLLVGGHLMDPVRRARLEQAVEMGAQARDRLIQSNLRLVVSIARRYRGRGLSLLDLIQEGNIGLQTGIEKYDWRKGFRLSTYIFWWIRQAIVRALANNGRVIRLPVHAGDLLRDAKNAEQELHAELGRRPTRNEVAKRLGIQPDRLEAIQLAALAPVSLDVPLAEDSTQTRGDTVVDDTALSSVLSAGEGSELQSSVADVLDTLPEREREVIQLRYGLGTPETWSLSQIGRRLGVTRERARQLEGQALRRMRGDVRLQRALVELTAAS
jgi:RNA polymerase primary sigma factor